ncbi:hypothetical protein F0344_15335 [Streptomyces finlayi]|uniref:Uncharacterized protein n=1 Tax=Streptomyces finlayi TaxID=67296 RepID=A0A7G7BKF6_9ACTN|nr:hypothetical protein [Streptomyces finlayi]QNE75821.1 hypothetical protein F0344_15335 [Streptomyces finlayi]
MAFPRLRVAVRRLPGYAAVLPVLADTGGTSERLWLLGGLGFALTGAGAVARAATRGRGRGRDHG